MMRTMKRSRRMALVAATVILGLSACGDPDSTGTAGSTATTVPAPVVIHSSSGVGTSNAGGAAPAAATEGDTKMRVAGVNYSYSGDLPALDGSAGSWFFPPDVTPTLDQVKAVAAAFGITGEPTMLPADQGGGWTVGPTDYTGPSVTVSANATGDWWFSPGPVAGTISSAGCATGSGIVAPDVSSPDPATSDPATSDPAASDPAPSDPGVTECSEPVPPANVPTADAAKAKAIEILTGLGADAGQYQFDTNADEWGAYVTAWLTVEGHRTPMSASVGFGAEGAVTWASGFLGTPKRGGDYPRIGAAAGLAKLQEQATGWMTTDVGPGVKDAIPAATAAPAPDQTGSETTDGAGVAGEPGPIACATDGPLLNGADGVASSSAAAEPGAPAGTDPGATDPATDVVPPGCAPGTFEPMNVVLTGVKEDLTTVWATDGTVWLLPAYTFTSDDGGTYTILAVDDSYVQTDAVPVAEPATGGAEPATGSAPVEATDGATADTAAPTSAG